MNQIRFEGHWCLAAPCSIIATDHEVVIRKGSNEGPFVNRIVHNM